MVAADPMSIAIESETRFLRAAILMNAAVLLTKDIYVCLLYCCQYLITQKPHIVFNPILNTIPQDLHKNFTTIPVYFILRSAIPRTCS